MDWENVLDKREKSEVDFNRVYASQYAHGTDGHNIRLLVAKLARMLDFVDWVVHEDTSDSHKVQAIKEFFDKKDDSE